MNKDMREAVEACGNVWAAQMTLRRARSERDMTIRALQGSPQDVAAKLRDAVFSQGWDDSDIKLMGISAGAVRLMRERPSLTDGAESETLGA